MTSFLAQPSREPTDSIGGSAKKKDPRTLVNMIVGKVTVLVRIPSTAHDTVPRHLTKGLGRLERAVGFYLQLPGGYEIFTRARARARPSRRKKFSSK